MSRLCCARSNLALFFISVFLGAVVTISTVRMVHVLTEAEDPSMLQPYNNRLLPRTEGEVSAAGGGDEVQPVGQQQAPAQLCSCDNNNNNNNNNNNERHKQSIVALDNNNKDEIIRSPSPPPSHPHSPHPLNHTITSLDTPTIFIITPTHKRLTQKVDLVRLCQTLMLVPRITWIVVEDSSTYSNLVKNLLKNCKVKSVHLHEKTTTFVSRKKGGGGHRGVEQRNKGLKWIRENHKLANVSRGVVYFGDDDNGYDIRLFEEMRHTRVVSIWPVAFVGMLNYEGPNCKNGKVTDFHTMFRPDRKFPIDMAAFAVNLRVLTTHSNVYIDHKSEAGMLESNFLSSLGLSRDQLEPKANNCEEIYVWHIKTEKPKMPYARKHPGNKRIEV